MRFIEARLIVPRIRNVGSTLTSDDYRDGLVQLELHLADCFGGFTASIGEGAWVDGGRILHEPVYLYLIGFCDEDEDAAAAFDGLREYVKVLLDQRAVYLSHYYIEDAPVQ